MRENKKSILPRGSGAVEWWGILRFMMVMQSGRIYKRPRVRIYIYIYSFIVEKRRRDDET